MVPSTERAACERCGREGWRGDWPGEGGIVHGGGEVSLGDYRDSLLCDDCADELMGEARA